MAYLTNGTLNYNLTLEEACCERKLAYVKERNKFDPTYPDPNDERFDSPPTIIFLSNSIGEYNIVDGQICNFLFTKRLHNAASIDGRYVNFMTFPFDYSVRELKEALKGHDVEVRQFSGIRSFEVRENGSVHSIAPTPSSNALNDNVIIKAGHPIILYVDQDASTHILTDYTFNFKNKKIVINDMVTEPIEHDWYFVSNIARNKADCTGLSTATNVLIVGTLGMQFGTATASLGPCGGFLEYRGKVPNSI